MNYKESKKILDEIKKAKKILISCHRRPDPDSVSSALAMYSALNQFGKDAGIVCRDDVLENLKFLPHVNSIKKVDFSNFDFSDYDLHLMLDSANWRAVTGVEELRNNKDLKVIQIDHHELDNPPGDIKIIKPEVSSNAEVLYLVFKDWGVDINSEIAGALLTGIIADTLSFRTPSTTARTLKIASNLIEKGADRQHIVYQLFLSMNVGLLKFLGEVLLKLLFDEELKFAWSAVDNSVYKKYDLPISAKNYAANMFFGSIKDARFGIIMVEERQDKLSVSFRSAGKFPTNKIAEALGGGGHKDSSATKIEGLPFDKAVEKVLKVARKYAKKNNID